MGSIKDVKETESYILGYNEGYRQGRQDLMKALKDEVMKGHSHQITMIVNNNDTPKTDED